MIARPDISLRVNGPVRAGGAGGAVAHFHVWKFAHVDQAGRNGNRCVLTQTWEWQL